MQHGLGILCEGSSTGSVVVSSEGLFPSMSIIVGVCAPVVSSETCYVAMNLYMLFTLSLSIRYLTC